MTSLFVNQKVKTPKKPEPEKPHGPARNESYDDDTASR
ncbi:hypothetical protein ABID19_005921 [Mesorhizobium robiniae]|uniref:Uncharacterized protein n=1 Tax=Mesorhizobium robiniae TaxID=559315 RepID=A0ABV2GX37_9HYPH